MGKTGGHPELLLVLTAQAGADPVAKRGGGLAAIDRHIKDFPLNATHQLPLCMGILLKVQTAQNPWLEREWLSWTKATGDCPSASRAPLKLRWFQLS